MPLATRRADEDYGENHGRKEADFDSDDPTDTDCDGTDEDRGDNHRREDPDSDSIASSDTKCDEDEQGRTTTDLPGHVGDHAASDSGDVGDVDASDSSEDTSGKSMDMTMWLAPNRDNNCFFNAALAMVIAMWWDDNDLPPPQSMTQHGRDLVYCVDIAKEGIRAGQLQDWVLVRLLFITSIISS